jgi:uncharacterized protein (UPF0332 family)
MKPREFHDFAKQLLRTTNAFRNEPATVRSAVSRAYYSLFLSSRDFLREINRPISATGKSDHQHVADQLQRIEDRELMKVGSALTRYRKKRNSADYSMSDLQSEKVTEANIAIADIERMLENLDKIRSDSARMEKLRRKGSGRSTRRPDVS